MYSGFRVDGTIPKGALYGPSFERHLQVCAIYSKTTVTPERDGHGGTGIAGIARRARHLTTGQALHRRASPGRFRSKPLDAWPWGGASAVWQKVRVAPHPRRTAEGPCGASAGRPIGLKELPSF